MASEHTSGPQTLFVIKEMLTKTTMIYHSISSRMANIKKIKKQTSIDKDMEQLKLSSIAWGNAKWYHFGKCFGHAF